MDQTRTWTIIAGATNEGVKFSVNLDVNTERCTQHPFSSPSRVWFWSTTHCLLCRSMSATTSLGSIPAPKKCKYIVNSLAQHCYNATQIKGQ